VKVWGQNIDADFSFGMVLGSGSFGTVKKATNLKTKEEVAIKSVPNEIMKEHAEGSSAMEISIAKRLRHPHIAALLTIYHDDTHAHLVMELCTGGDLLDRVQNGEWFSDTKIGNFLWEMLSGLAYCHHNFFCHRDLKLENYLFDTPRSDAHLKLIDFGLARTFKKGTPMTTMVGSPIYVAPEVFNLESYDERRDIWSIGIITYMLCTRKPPYSIVTAYDDVVPAVKAGSVKWGSLDARLRGDHPLKVLVSQMLKFNPAERPSAKALADDPWVKKRRPGQQSGGCCSLQ